MDSAADAKANIAAKKKSTKTAMAPRIVMIFTSSCVREIAILTLRLDRRIIPFLQ